MNGPYIENQGEGNLENFSNALIRMEIGTPIAPNHPAYGAIMSFPRKNNACFVASGFEENVEYPRQFTNVSFTGIPFVCVINTGILVDNNPEIR